MHEETASSGAYRQSERFCPFARRQSVCRRSHFDEQEDVYCACLSRIISVSRTPLTEEQTNLLQAFVSQAGIAIENALLYEQMQDSVAKLRRLTDYTDNVLQSIEAAILTTDTRGQVARCNRAAEMLLQASARHCGRATLEQAFDNLHLPPDEQEHLLQVISAFRKRASVSIGSN